MKAVLLTCSTGQGHNSAAHAVGEALARRGVSCETVDALSFLGERAGELVAGAFVNIAVKTPRAFGLMYSAGEKLSEGIAEHMKSPVYLANKLYAESLMRYLDENQIDAAICPHLFPAEALTYLRRAGKLRAKTFFVSTDYTCIPFLEETDMTRVFLPHADLRREYVQRGIPDACIREAGIPVSKRFTGRTPKAEARRALGVPEDVPMFLVMTGGEGCGNAVTLARLLLDRLDGADARVYVLVGRNEKLHADVSAAFAFDARVSAESFTDRVDLYMDACDVLLTKPGGVSTTEAAVKGVPFIHTPPIPGCETKNARFFAERGMSIVAFDEESAADSAVRLARDEGQKRRIVEAQRQYVNPRADEDVCDEIARVCEGE